MIYLDIGGSGPGLIDPERAAVPVLDRGLLYGDGLFETMRAEAGQVPLLPWHLERLSHSAATLGLSVPPLSAVRAALLQVVLAAGLTRQAIRLTLTRGVSDQRGYAPPVISKPTLLITTAPYSPPFNPVNLCTASTRIFRGSHTWQHKTLSSLDKVMARAEANRAGCDEALLLNSEGRVVEATSANLFVVRGDLWSTPSIDEGCLPGVMRRQVMRLSEATETRLELADLFSADAVYLTNALMGCLPVATLAGRLLPSRPLPPWAANLFTTPPVDFP